MKTFLVLSAILATSVMAQDTELLIGMRTVEGADLVQYRSIEAEIPCAVAGAEDVTGIMNIVQRLSEKISSSSLFPAAQGSLRSKLGEQVFEGSAEPLLLVRELLEASNPDVRSLAFDHLLNVEGWERDERVRSTLLRLLGDAASSADERSTVVWLFASKGLFESIQDTALGLARDHADANLAHSVAQTIVVAHEADPAVIARFAASDARALREEAARLKYRCGDAQRGDPALFLAIARDKSEPEWVRGNAIETLALCPGDPAHQAALAELLNRSAWFFGAAGQHFPVHSLALVIPPLARSESPAMRSRLIALRRELRALRSGEREYVEWVLANALGEHREVFYGPVDPNR